MIVFRDQYTRADPTALLSALRLEILRFARGSPPAHDDAVRLLIGMGKLEAALSDALAPVADGIDSTTRRLREVSRALGHVLWHTWREQPHRTKRWLEQAAATLAYLELQALPKSVQVSVAEGYAYYAVYPEMYLEAARRCHQDRGVFNAVCLGLRSIGTSLSAVVAAALEELGCRVVSYTLRPRGHPFERHPLLTTQLQTVLQAERDALFLIVDEGPGISGSSVGGTAELLSKLGIEDEKVILFPSWTTDGTGLRSSQARAHWRRHRQFVTSFEEIWLDSGRLSRELPAGRWQDLSAGAWRDELYQNQEAFPAVQPQHERRKYLVQPFSDASPEGGPRWLSFAGLGHEAASKLRRAEQLASAGFTVAPEKVVHGFLVRPFTPGTPLSASGSPGVPLLERMASYLAYMCREFPSEPSIAESSIREMTAANVAEGLGEQWMPQLDAKLSAITAGCCERSVALDGRMQPHEWIRTSGGYLKTDALDHHDDHFYPGCHDIAWDVAAACLEFGLRPDARQWLVGRYRALSGDRAITGRLPFHAITYLAFRLGYTTLAANTLGESPDGRRFGAAAHRYQQLLRTELDSAEERWDA